MPRRIVEMIRTPLTGQDCYKAVHRTVYERPSTVYLWGTNGNGKTHMGSWLFAMWHLVACRAHHENEEARLFGWAPSARWASSNEITAALKNFSKGHFDFDREMRVYTRPNVLLVDDLWADKATETDVQNLVEIIEIRRNAGARTIITGNHDARSLMSLSRRFTDRLAEGLVIEFTGTSHRVHARKA